MGNDVSSWHFYKAKSFSDTPWVADTHKVSMKSSATTNEAAGRRPAPHSQEPVVLLREKSYYSKTAPYKARKEKTE